MAVKLRILNEIVRTAFLIYTMRAGISYHFIFYIAYNIFLDCNNNNNDRRLYVTLPLPPILDGFGGTKSAKYSSLSFTVFIGHTETTKNGVGVMWGGVGLHVG